MRTSATTSELSKALSKFQGIMPAVEKKSKNPYYNSWYADLPEIISKAQAPLDECGLSIAFSHDGSEIDYIETELRLEHESGEWYESKLKMALVKKDPQGVGTAATYSRRYLLCSMLNIAADDDDDANSHVKQPPAKATKSEPAPKPDVKESQNKAVDIGNDQLAAIKEKIQPLFTGLFKDDKTLISEKYADEGKTLSASKTLTKLNDCYSELLQREIIRMYDELAAMNPQNNQFYKVASIKKHTNGKVLSGNISECKDHETLEKLKSHLSDEISKENSAVQ